MTNDGGVNCTSVCGVIYELSRVGTSYTEPVIHRFAGPPNDGKGPFDDLVFPAGWQPIWNHHRGRSGLCHGGLRNGFQALECEWHLGQRTSLQSRPGQPRSECRVIFDKQGISTARALSGMKQAISMETPEK